MNCKSLLAGFGFAFLFCVVTFVVVAIRLNSVFGFVSPSLESRLSQYESIVADVKSGTLAPDASGFCTTPATCADAIPRCRVFVGTTKTGTTVILFPTGYGRGADVDGYFYSSAPLVAADYYAIDWGSGGTQQHLDVGTIDMLSISSIRKNWYWATRRLD